MINYMATQSVRKSHHYVGYFPLSHVLIALLPCPHCTEVYIYTFICVD